MTLITAGKIKKYYGERLIFAFEELEINDTDRVGIVGANGAGKTTLLEVLAGRIKPDEGVLKRSGSLAYIPQLDRADSAVMPEMASRMMVGGIQPGHASGGEEMRLKIARALSENADLLLADEPTSNLDIQGIAILRQMLKSWRGALVIVSHDRDLLDEFCTGIIEIENGKLAVFSGNYSDYQKEKARQIAFQRFEYEQYRKEKAGIEKAIIDTAARAAKVRKAPKRMGLSEARLHRREATEAAAKISRQATAMQTRLQKLAVKEAPPTEPEVKMIFADLKKQVSKTPIQCSNLKIAYGRRVLLEETGFVIPAGTRTAVIGPNGCGKTTLLRYIQDCQAGVKIAPGVHFSWFEQDLSVLDEEKSVLENTMEAVKKPEWMARTVLARLLIKGDDVYKQGKVLSGGERCKVCFAKMLLSGADLLVMDEPTNYLDLNSLEALGRLLSEWPGTLIFVSHDRAFVSRVATRLLIFENQRLVSFEGNYHDYLGSHNNQGQNQEVLILKMRLAELAGRLGIETNEETRCRYQEEIDRLGEKIRLLAENGI